MGFLDRLLGRNAADVALTASGTISTATAVLDRPTPPARPARPAPPALAPEPARTPGPARVVPLIRAGAPAVQRDRVAAAGVSLAKKFDAAGVSLEKRKLDGIRGDAIMLLDHSGSMVNDYENGYVQALVDRALAFALQIDQDGTVPVIRFDSYVHEPVDVTLDNYRGIVNRKLYSRRDMGSTNLTDALRRLLEAAKVATLPIFAIIVTDGAPNNPATASLLIEELAQYPVFIKFLAVEQVRYLEQLDNDLPNRLLDNVNSQFIGRPDTISDEAFAEKMTAEWETWIDAAQKAGVLA